MPGQNGRYAINSVLRAAQILQSFSLEKPTYTHAEISKNLGLNKAAVTRLLFTLEKAGLLEKDVDSGKYGLAVSAYQIGSVYINLTGIPQAARPHLSELTALCKESTHLSILREYEVVYIDKVECSRPIRMMSYVGRKMPAYCTGTGKVLLAHLSEEDLKTYFHSVRLKQRTPNTITRAALLRTELEEVRRAGYAVDNAENEMEVMSLAAPIRDQTGKVVAAVSTAGPVYRMTEKGVREKFVPLVIQAAERISRRLGCG
ncbi:MAG: IclR family transcriptional regulator [Deltaproteobacteria bacterium HGW-Deltaproteobacteria-15]|jgi:DNA-binding IclR family transcriptional regulator|nr:MAG: IclR family transcriptional regulator [Deltaproteobacteria bacterium HGW-Deltaproteobacteria-15]